MFANNKSVKRNQVENQVPSQKMDQKIDQKLGQKLRKINVLVINEEEDFE